MSTAEQTGQKIYQKYGWTLLLLFSVAVLLFGLGDMISGMAADVSIAEAITGEPWAESQASNPRLANLVDLGVRGGGAHLFVLGILTTMICVNQYRVGERWAWYALWTLPLWAALVFVMFATAERQPGAAAPAPMLSAPVFIAIGVLGLLLPLRTFFPRR